MEAIFYAILKVILFVVDLMLGGISIGIAVSAFKEKHYTTFGVEVMVAILFMLSLIKLSF